jgi:galactan 5-O-arabinofuranosyltransferase
MLVHTYWFLPFGLATLLAIGYDAVQAHRGRRPAPRLPLRRALAIGAVGLAVSAVSWVPVVVARLRLPSDSLQLRYSHVGGNLPAFPSPFEASEVAGVVGLAWLGEAAWRRLWRRDLDARTGRLAGALALALAGCLATLGLGVLAERADVGLLAFKTQDALRTVLLSAGVLGSADWLRRSLARHESGQRTRLARGARLLPVVLTAAAAATAAYALADWWVTGRPALVAQTTRYPEGSVPTGDPTQEPYIRVLFVDSSDPSVAAVRSAWRSLRPDVPFSGAVLVTTRVDLLATTPVYGFVAYKSIYSHPNGRFEDRMALLEEVAACPTSTCAARLLRDNDFDPVDGLVLQREGTSLVLPFMVDDFPDRTRRAQVAFPDRVLRGPEFVRTQLGRIVVVALRP